ncbi:MAG: prefoldin subunit alpha [archaeon]|nr:prefoldin subunit alpha [archaeon]
MSEEQEIQKLAYLYQELDERLKNLGERISYLKNSQMGLSITKQTIDELKNAEPGQEIILPVGNMAFVKAKIIEPDKIIMSIGKDVLVERNCEQALILARKYEDDFINAQKLMEEQAQQLSAQINQIRPQLEQYNQRLSQLGPRGINNQ